MDTRRYQMASQYFSPAHQEMNKTVLDAKVNTWLPQVCWVATLICHLLSSSGADSQRVSTFPRPFEGWQAAPALRQEASSSLWHRQRQKNLQGGMVRLRGPQARYELWCMHAFPSSEFEFLASTMRNEKGVLNWTKGKKSFAKRVEKCALQMTTPIITTMRATTSWISNTVGIPHFGAWFCSCSLDF